MSSDRGSWEVVEESLAQTDSRAPRAKAHLAVAQSGIMQYEFEVRYLAGAEDLLAAFGVHVFVDEPSDRASWGSGTSYLLWLTFDPIEYGGSGLWAEVYRSTGDNEMELYEHEGIQYRFEIPAGLLQGITLSNLDRYLIPVTIQVDADSGQIRVKDPIRSGVWWTAELGMPIESGSFVALRTNSVAARFDNISVTRLQ